LPKPAATHAFAECPFAFAAAQLPQLAALTAAAS
jgi:hypothetical protein